MSEMRQMGPKPVKLRGAVQSRNDRKGGEPKQPKGTQSSSM
jgi:hypothetical protein